MLSLGKTQELAESRTVRAPLVGVPEPHASSYSPCQMHAQILALIPFRLHHLQKEGNEKSRLVHSAQDGDIRHLENGIMTFAGAFCVSE